MDNEERVEQTIELDCEPCSPRPDSYIEGVMKDSGVDYDGRETVSRLFGCWTWDFSDIAPETWAKASPIIGERIEALYQSGAIRYGSW